jgi:hypothetical protein
VPVVVDTKLMEKGNLGRARCNRGCYAHFNEVDQRLQGHCGNQTKRKVLSIKKFCVKLTQTFCIRDSLKISGTQAIGAKLTALNSRALP